MRKQKAARKRTRAQGQIVENTAAPFLRRRADMTNDQALAMFHDKGFTRLPPACTILFSARKLRERGLRRSPHAPMGIHFSTSTSVVL